MTRYQITFTYEGNEEKITVEARNVAHANYQATQYAISKKMPSHMCQINRA